MTNKIVPIITKIFYKDGDTLYQNLNGEPSKRIIAELKDGYLVVYYGYFTHATGTYTEFVNKDMVGKKRERITQL